MGLFSWLFGGKKDAQNTPKPPKRKKVYGFDEKRAHFSKELSNLKKSNLCIKKIKIIVDKKDLDACSAIKRMKKIHSIDSVPLIPLDREKCQYCTCYYEPIVPMD